MRTSNAEGGYSVLELLVVVVVIAVVAGMAATGVASARNRMKLNGAAQELAGNLEKARTNSIKRRAEAGAESSLSVLNATTYRLHTDFNADGVLGTTEFRDIQLPDNVTFVTTPMPAAAAFDRMGHLTTNLTITLTSGTASVTQSITASGGISALGAVAPPTLSGTPIPTPTPTPAPTATPVPPASSGGCSLTATTQPSPLTIKKSGKNTGYITINLSVYGDPGTVTVSPSIPELTISPTSAVVSPTTPVVFSVRDTKNSVSDYTAYLIFKSPCGARTVTITVTQN